MNENSVTLAPACINIYVSEFQPFSSRIGLDTVMRLRFEYDKILIDRLKAILAVYAVPSKHKVIGGWLPKHRCWFIEADVWGVVRDELQLLDYKIVMGKP